MSVRLIKYEAARVALKEASQIDEVKDIRDKAQALAAYARQAKNDDMIVWATEIKLRAERRAGEMLAETERAKGGNPKLTPTLGEGVGNPTLADVGLTAKQSSSFQAIAAIPEDKFEEAVTTGKETTASLVRKSPKKAKALKEAKEPKPKKAKPAKPIDEWKTKYDALVDDYAELKENRDDLAGELKTCEAIRTNTIALEMKQLREHLKLCTRRRDELMANAVEMRKSLVWWRKQAEKLGYKAKAA